MMFPSRVQPLFSSVKKQSKKHEENIQMFALILAVSIWLEFMCGVEIKYA